MTTLCYIYNDILHVSLSVMCGALHWSQRLQEIPYGTKYFFFPTGADVNVTSSGTGDTPLHITSRRHDHDLSRVLIEYGANLSAINKENKKPSQLIANERQGSDKMTSLFKYYDGKIHFIHTPHPLIEFFGIHSCCIHCKNSV